MEVAGADLGPGVGDADDGLAEIFFGEADGAEVGAGRGAAGAFGEGDGVFLAGCGTHGLLGRSVLVEGEAAVGDAGLVVGRLGGGEGGEVGDEGGHGFVEVFVAIFLEDGVVGALGEGPEDDVGAGVDEDDAELAYGFA